MDCEAEGYHSITLEDLGVVGYDDVSLDDVLKDYSAFIFRVKQCKAKVLQLFEMSGTACQTMLCLIPGGFHLKANWIVLWQ